MSAVALRSALLTLPEVRDAFPWLGVNTARDLMHQAGAFKLGRRLVVTREDLDAEIQRRRLSERLNTGP